jgi:LysR family nitrogen assimilation transcriptional regulator
MELRQLKYFLKIVEYGNMTRAAEALFIAQPALSQQMRNLEEELGVKLFHRVANGMRPTPAGLILRIQGRNILRQIDEAVGMVRNESDIPTGEVAIALPSSTARTIAIPLLRTVRTTYPGISVKFIEAPSAGLMRLLEAGDADMVICVDTNARNSLSTVPLVNERLYLIELPSSVRATQRQIAVGALAEIPLVLPASPNTIRDFVDTALRRKHATADLVAEINSTSLLLQAVRAGVGATILPLSAVSEDLDAGKIVAIPLAGPRTTRQLVLCTLPKATQTAASVAVRSLIPPLVSKLIATGAWKGAIVI